MLFCPRIWQRWRDLAEAGRCIRRLPREEASLKEGFVRPPWSPVPGACPSALTCPPALVPSSSSCLGAAPPASPTAVMESLLPRKPGPPPLPVSLSGPSASNAGLVPGWRSRCADQSHEQICIFCRAEREHLHTGSLLTLLAAALHASWALPADGPALR